MLKASAHLSGSPTSWITLLSTQVDSSRGGASTASPVQLIASATNCSSPWRTFQCLWFQKRLSLSIMASGRSTYARIAGSKAVTSHGTAHCVQMLLCTVQLELRHAACSMR